MDSFHNSKFEIGIYIPVFVPSDASSRKLLMKLQSSRHIRIVSGFVVNVLDLHKLLENEVQPLTIV